MSVPPPVPPDQPAPEPSPRPRRPHKEPADRSAQGEPVLRRTIVKPAGSPVAGRGIVPDPVDAAYVASRLTALTHELANLLDGSLRVINLARRTAGDQGADAVARHIETVHAAMLQMADLVRNSMSGLTPVGPEAMKHALGAGGTLAAAISHAVAVMAPVAEERGIQLINESSPDVAESPAGPMYGVLINAIRNSIESIERAGHPEGRILVRAWLEAGRTGRSVGIEVCDDGAGPPPIAGGTARRPRTVFDPGVTSKPGSAGIGLALCKEVVDHLGGTIELSARGDSVGAVLRIRYPAPPSGAPSLDRRVG